MKSLWSVVFACMLIGCGGREIDAQRQPDVFLSSTTSKSSAREASSVVSIAGYRDAYQIQVNGASVAVTRKSDNTTQTFSTSQELHFFDRNISFNIEGVDGQAYRLYQAAFNRKPDLAGLGYWSDAMRKGYHINDVSAGFQASDEFRTLYGTAVSNEKWITLVYNNVLHRAPDDAGLKWWVDVT